MPDPPASTSPVTDVHHHFQLLEVNFPQCGFQGLNSALQPGSKWCIYLLRHTTSSNIPLHLNIRVLCDFTYFSVQ